MREIWVHKDQFFNITMVATEMRPTTEDIQNYVRFVECEHDVEELADKIEVAQDFLQDLKELCSEYKEVLSDG